MPGPTTVQDLVDEVRQQTDEQNPDDLGDADIVAALNRAQRKAASVIVKHCPDLLLTDLDVSLTSGTDTYDIPTNAYGRRLSHITSVRGTSEFPLKRVSHRDLYKFAGGSTTTTPYVYAVHGSSYQLRPTPSGGTVKLWYPRTPETLVLPQGRVDTISVASSYVLVDDLGDDLTTSTADLGAFVNIVNGTTGEVRVTLQISALTTATEKIAFKTSGLTYATVYNRTVAVAIPTTVAEQDYVCSVRGTCVPELPDECHDFLVQYAVTEIRRRMGEPTQDEAAALAELEQVVQRLWAGRESIGKITAKSWAWSR